jgi:hypothetical protein
MNPLIEVARKIVASDPTITIAIGTVIISEEASDGE